MKAVKSVQKMARVMQMISVTKFGKMKEFIKIAEKNAEFFRDSASLMFRKSDVFASCVSEYLKTCDSTLVIVIGSDRGLCGSFNNALIKFSEEYIKIFLENESPSNVSMIFFGKKIFSKLSKEFGIYSPKNIEVGDISLPPDFEVMEHVINGIIEKRSFKKVCIIHNKFIQVSLQEPIARVLFPFSKIIDTPCKDSSQTIHSSALFSVELCSVEFIKSFIHQYLLAELYSCIASSQASENAARMIAMDSANRNSRELIAKLGLVYNRIRQDAITTGIIEVVSAAESS